MRDFMKKYFVFLLLSGSLISSLFAQPKTITLLHTNDMHASFVPHEATWIKTDPKPMVGGFNELSFVVDSMRHAHPVTMLLDAGDVMTGNPITEYPFRGADGGALFEMMNRIGYEVWTPGNHDFDVSSANLRKLIDIASFPVTAANIVDPTGAYPIHNIQFKIIEKNGLKIGVIGLMSSDFYNLVNKKSSQGIVILPPVETLKKLISELRPKTDLLIALTHQGVDDDTKLAEQLTGLDVIVGGHSHTRLKTPKVVNGVIIVQTGSNCENLGYLDLTVENHKVTASQGGLIQLWYNSSRPKTILSLFIDSLQNKIDMDYAEVIGTLKSDWTRGKGESNVGNFIADGQREAIGADVGFMNDHGIRRDVPTGPLTKRALFEVLPFRNILTTFSVTGVQLKNIVEFYIKEKPPIQTSGLQVQWKHDANGSIQFSSFFVNGKSLDEKKTYTIAASDYLVGEAKRHFGLEVTNANYSDLTVFSVMEKKVRTEKNINSKIENRIQEIK